MKPTAYFYISGFIFAVVGTAHLLRAIFQVPVVAGEWEFPLLLSWPGGIAGIGLCLWAFRLARRDGTQT